MRYKRQDLGYLAVIIFTALLAAGLAWANFQYASHSQAADAFAPMWSAAQRVIKEQANPYNLESLEVFLPTGSTADSRFVYPFFTMLILLPFGLISSYPLAQAIWMSLLMTSLVALIFTGLSLTRWKPSNRLLGALVLFSFSGYPAVRAVFTGNPSLLVGMLIAIGLQMVIKGQDRAAGIIFGLTLLNQRWSLCCCRIYFSSLSRTVGLK